MSERSSTAPTAGDLMVKDVTSVSPSTTVGTALDLMFEKKILALPVVENDRCVGIVTATDLVALLRSTDKVLRSEYPHFDDCLWAVELVQRKLDEDPVTEIMSEVMMTTKANTTIDEIAEKMTEEWIHHVPVVDEDDKLIGFLSSFDFVRNWSA